MMKFSSYALAAAVSALAATSALAFPDKPIELVVPFSPGGGSDVSARVFAQCLEGQIDQKVLIKNIEGARGKIGEVEVRDARPDGYKLLWAHQGMDMGLATGRSDYNYTAFKPVASTVAMNYGIFAGANSGIDGVESLKSKVSENPGSYTIGTALNGFSHFAALDFLEQAGVSVDDVRTIPMSGDKNRIVAAIQGNLTLVPTAVGAAAPYVDSGDMKPVAVLSADRDPRLGDAQTGQEQGADSQFAMYFTTYAPKDTPQEAIDTLADAWIAAAEDPACQEKLGKQSMTVVPAKGTELDDVLAKRYARIEELADKFNLTSEGN
ncbi:tripartite tricarboxylate transporter substrate binding protein [Notoacmeibacter sp. MSK16QG-6]|uniref:tripartite tricarboxylate transporter substrate binding protein n=1 Tax=Notoacmeibacter sp. MSK16QG-6 TaxID=2957982 RepID=UPI0020A1AD82|nr:tripartite tricarboxylate transporter substrate binding protein [Notoacmeibacter sp. MSK16QG-6]MCP1200558.1 tripartite tricarboxylate transporter substrate binding protein [Notoacmeibacter sp. MSK16QG-6]